MTIEKLLAENKKLKEENYRLKELLRKNNIDYIAEKEKILTTDDKIKIYSSYFKGRNDVYSEKYIKNGKKAYAKVCINKFNRDLCDMSKYKHCINCPNENRKTFGFDEVYDHFIGKKSYAIYPVINNNCYFIAIDFDDNEFKDCALAYKKECDKLNIDSIIELSQSGEGAHVWIFFNDLISCKKARRLGDYILTCAMQNNKNISFKSYDRFFPSQDIVDKDGIGNCIALPLQGDCVRNRTSVFVDDDFLMFDNQIGALSNITKVNELDVDLILKNYADNVDVEISNKSFKKLNLMISDFPLVFKIILKDDIYFSKEGFSSRSISILKRLAIIHNPEFYEKQAKRISTYKIERIIELFKENIDYISLPRGCFSDLVEILEFVGIAYEVEDRRIALKEINVEYNAILRETQKNAVDTLLKYDNGLLIAPTGSGKTIMGMEVISRLKKPTLILVEKVKLLEQWKERISQFMKVYYNEKIIEPGIYYGAKKKLTGIIDIASIKSIKDEDDLYDKYEIIIGDEIHHIASKTYEEIIRKFQAKHIYGFTATPKRSDNLEKIIYKIISPIRATLEENNRTFEKILKPRFTKFKNKDSYDLMNYADLLNELYKDSNRNQQIVEDIVEEYKKNKCILVLTERIEHINILKNLLSNECDNIYTISGLDGAKARRQFNDSINKLEKQYIIISTGSFLGEGFDLGSLNTLFITMPFKFSGKLQQQTGRIHREYEGKNQVVVYDYVDIKIGKLAHQFQIRLKQYKKEEYNVIDENDKPELLYDYSNYSNQLYDDISNANNVKLLFNYHKEERLNKLLELNDKIEIITDEEINSNVKTVKEHSPINAIIIDNRIIWYGSINPFAYSKKDDDFLVDEMKRWKIEFRRLLDIIYPGLDKIFEDLYIDYVQNLLLEYSHPEIIRKKRLDTIAKFIEKHTCHKEAFSLKQAQALKEYAENCASGCSYKSYLVSQFDTVIHTLNSQIKHLETTLDEIIEIAKKLPNYEIIRSIPGIADNLASRILSEIGDIDRFDNSSQLVAYAGIDPQIYQSGQISGLHLKISKKGNKKLRCLLFLAVTCMIKTNRDTKIVEFYKRKKADGLASRSALVASMNKLLRIIHSLCKNGCLFK